MAGEMMGFGAPALSLATAFGGGGAWVDPITGQLLRQPNPTVPGQMQEAQAALAKFQDDQALKNWQQQMAFMEKTKNVGKIDPEAAINRGTEELGASQMADTRALKRAFGASGVGGGSGGGLSGGMRKIFSDYAGKRANLARDERDSAARWNAQGDERWNAQKLGMMAAKPTPRAGLAALGGGSGLFEHKMGFGPGGGGDHVSGEEKSYNRNPIFTPGANGPEATPFRPGINRSRSFAF